MIEGVDYASVDDNKAPDTVKARAAGVRFAIVRGTYGANPDPHMTRDRAAWSMVSGGFGAYLFLSFGKDHPCVEDQVRAFVNHYGKRTMLELPPTLDVEFPHGREALGLTAKQALTSIESAYTLLEHYYQNVMVYTSARVWHEDLADLDSKLLSQAPLWVKTPYVYKAGNKPHPEAAGKVTELPVPWRSPSSAGAWLHQYQGDAKGYPGFSSTVDCNAFLAYWQNGDDGLDVRVPWVLKQLARHNTDSVVVLQHVRGLTPDGIIGPATFAALTQ